MINRELVGRELLAAILAGVVVTFEKIPPAKGNAGIGNPVKLPQGDDLRDFKTERDALDEAFAICWGQLRPIGPAVCAEIFGIDNQGCALIDHHERPGNRGHMNRLPITIKNQRRPLKYTTRHGGT